VEFSCDPGAENKSLYTVASFLDADVHFGAVIDLVELVRLLHFGQDL
jgi:hypothetical protein